MNILLVIPQRDFDRRNAFSKMPDELFTMAAVLEKAGHSVRIFDNNVDSLQPKDFVPFQPSLIGFTVVTSFQITSAIAQSKEFKELIPGVKVIWGHMHPSMIPEQTVIEPFIDYVAVGAGEFTLLELVDQLSGDNANLQDIKGLVFKDNGRVVFNEPRPFLEKLDVLPDPAWHLVDMRKYWEKRITTGRGCPWDCSFCSAQAFHKGCMGEHSAERIIWQMERLQLDHDAKYIWFSGENFAFDQKRLEEFHDLYNRKNLKLNWCAEVSGMPSEDNIRLMAGSGCDKVKFCVENGSPRILELMNKSYTVDEAERTFRLFVKHEIMPTVFTMYGLPTQTAEEFKMTHELLARMDNPPYMFMKFVPYPGSRLFDYCVDKGLVAPPKNLAEWADFPMIYASKINLSDVPQKTMDEAASNFKKSFAVQRVRFSIKHNPKYFLKFFRDPGGFIRDLKKLFRYYLMVLFEAKLPASAVPQSPQMNPQENPKA